MCRVGFWFTLSLLCLARLSGQSEQQINLAADALLQSSSETSKDSSGMCNEFGSWRYLLLHSLQSHLQADGATFFCSSADSSAESFSFKMNCFCFKATLASIICYLLWFVSVVLVVVSMFARRVISFFARSSPPHTDNKALNEHDETLFAFLFIISWASFTSLIR